MCIDATLFAPHRHCGPGATERKQRKRRLPLLWIDLWCRALLLASVRDEGTDPFAVPDARLLWDVGLWPPSSPPFASPATMERDDAAHRFRQVRS